MVNLVAWPLPGQLVLVPVNRDRWFKSMNLFQKDGKMDRINLSKMQAEELPRDLRLQKQLKVSQHLSSHQAHREKCKIHTRESKQILSHSFSNLFSQIGMIEIMLKIKWCFHQTGSKMVLSKMLCMTDNIRLPNPLRWFPTGRASLTLQPQQRQSNAVAPKVLSSKTRHHHQLYQ